VRSIVKGKSRVPNPAANIIAFILSVVAILAPKTVFPAAYAKLSTLLFLIRKCKFTKKMTVYQFDRIVIKYLRPLFGEADTITLTAHGARSSFYQNFGIRIFSRRIGFSFAQLIFEVFVLKKSPP
jgi:hypothetical protein